MARVQRSRAARSDSIGRSTGFPSTGLFTAVDKEPDICSPPRKYWEKPAARVRVAARWPLIRLSGVSALRQLRDDAADRSKRSESGSSKISEVLGSRAD